MDGVKNVRSSGTASSFLMGYQLIEEATGREILVYVIQTKACRLYGLFQHIRLSCDCNDRLKFYPDYRSWQHCLSLKMLKTTLPTA